MNTKKCTKCLVDKPLNKFHKRHLSKDGLAHRCIDCVAAYSKALNQKDRTPQGPTKKCVICGIDKDVSCFTSRKRNADGLRSECKECGRKREKEYRSRPEYKAKATIKKRYRNYGMDDDTYQKLKDKQNGVCAICLKEQELLCVDHSHVTGKIRGLLCPCCNAGLGMFRDNTKNLKNAIQYLRYNV